MHELTPADIAQLAAVGISPELAAEQLARLRTAPPPIQLVRPATIGDGIEQFTTTRHLLRSAVLPCLAAVSS